MIGSLLQEINNSNEWLLPIAKLDLISLKMRVIAIMGGNPSWDLI